MAPAWTPKAAQLDAAARFVERVEAAGGLPDWVLQLHGPFRSKGLAATLKEFLTDAQVLIWQRWAKEYLPDHGLGNLVVPTAIYEDGAEGKRLEYTFYVMLGMPEDAMRLGASHVSKSRFLSPTHVPATNVVNTPDVAQWQQLRKGLTPAFLPLQELAQTVPVLEAMAGEMVSLWKAEVSTGDVLDVRSWMHHTALAVFANCMLGDPAIFPSASDQHGTVDLPFVEARPEHSASARDLFNLERVGRPTTPQELKARVSKMIQFSAKLLRRGQARLAASTRVGPLMERLLEVREDAVRFENMAAVLVAGHDTTAFTMQYLLMELARNQGLQLRVREECVRILGDVKAAGRGLSFSDLPRFELLTRCISETLRLWSVASVTFPRVTSHEDEVSSASGAAARLPTGTHFTFWNYGHHHSSVPWGNDALHFNPDREWHPHELQRGCLAHGEPEVIARTPCTRRFHPFSVPPRDCMGKGFALTEMRVLIPRILCSFRLELPGDSELRVLRGPVYDDDVFASWARGTGGPVQPHQLRLHVVPLPPTASPPVSLPCAHL